MPQLVRYEAARHALAEARGVDEVKDIRDKAVAMQAYAKQAKDTQLIGYATEIRLRAERRWGELYRPEVKAKGTREQLNGREPSGGSRSQPPEKTQPTLKDMGVTKTQSVKWQSLGALSEEKFDAKVEKAKQKAEDSTTSAPRHVKSEFTGENEWYTPSKYIEAARAFMGGIDLDPASSAQAQETIKAKRFHSIDDSGLTKKWHGRVWLNPPFAQPEIAYFCDKMIAEVKAGNVTEAIMLTHNYTDTAWFHAAESACSAICFTRGRIKFVRADGEMAAPTQGQAFFYYGSREKLFAAAFEQFGFVVKPT